MATEKTPGSPVGKRMKLSEATQMVETYANGCKEDHLHSLKISASFLTNIIVQNDCEYVRFFFAIDGAIAPDQIGVAAGHTLVAVGVNSKGENIKNGEDDSEVYEDLGKCPPICDGGNGETL